MAISLQALDPPQSAALVPQPWSSLGKMAYEAIVEGILTGVLLAGSQISIDRAAKQLSMSNTPVREALSRLAAERLVLFSANRGYTVTPQIGAEEYRQLFEARRTLELAAIRSAIIEPSSIARIERILASLRTIGATPEYKQYRAFNQGDREFHWSIVRMSRNLFLCHAWEQLNFHLHVGRLYAGAGVIDLEEARAEHEEVFAAIRESDRKKLLKRVGDHIGNAECRLRQLVKKDD